MAEILENQSIIFSEVLDCHLGESPMVMLAQYGDITQFQMGLSPCISDKQLIRNGGFSGSSDWSLGSGWTIADGQSCHIVSLLGSMSQVAPVADGVLVRLVLDIEVSSIGCLVTWGSFLQNIFVSGRYEFFFIADSASVFAITCAGSGAVCVNSISATSINTDFVVAILDEDGNAVDSMDTTDGYFNFEGGYFTASIDWETLGITDGCYRLGVIDPCPCSQRGIIPLDFITGIHNWSLASSWSILGGTATYDGSSTGQAILNHVLCSGTEYRVKYTISGMSGNEEFNVRLGAQNGTTVTSDGTYTENITASGTSFIMIGNSTSGTQTFDVTNMTIFATDPSLIYSNFIKVSSTDFGCKTYNIAMCNDSNALGFGFENTGFRPNFRIEASLVRGSYPMSRESYEYSNGVKSVTYGRERVARELGVDLILLLVDFMSLSLLVDHFYIDDVEYFVEDDEFPTVSWDDNQHLGGFTLNVSKKTQLIENRRLSSATVGCIIGGNPLFDEFGTEITDETGAVITDG